MTASAEYTAYVLEHLESLFPVRVARFFGGAGLYFDTCQFAMIMDNTLYFAVDADSRSKYEQAGMRPFSYLTKKGRVQVRKYYELPEDVLAEPEQLQHWANEAIEVAFKTQRPKRK